ncbi:2-oxo acid dehydrogenase subunit E2 [Planococcus glaciei]|nr:2-oxo acid dehydrogenase subunit E2 [Planococcus glaciei]
MGAWTAEAGTGTECSGRVHCGNRKKRQNYGKRHPPSGGLAAAAEPAGKAEELQQEKPEEESARQEPIPDQALDEAPTKEVPEKETAQENAGTEELPSEEPPEELAQQEQAALAEQAEAILEPEENDRESDAVPFSGIRGVIARRMTESLQNSAQLTETAWADVTKLHSKKRCIRKRSRLDSRRCKSCSPGLRQASARKCPY